jgi:hypothetical protein
MQAIFIAQNDLFDAGEIGDNAQKRGPGTQPMDPAQWEGVDG